MRVLLVVAALALAGTALAGGVAWQNKAKVAVTVNGHAFHHAIVESHDCTLSLGVYFEAPEKGYSDPKNAVRNVNRFQAEVYFANGQKVTSRVFDNAAAGQRMYDFDEDTTAAGCWAKDKNKIVKLDVIGCRGKNCDVGVFE